MLVNRLLCREEAKTFFFFSLILLSVMTACARVWGKKKNERLECYVDPERSFQDKHNERNGAYCCVFFFVFAAPRRKMGLISTALFV